MNVQENNSINKEKKSGDKQKSKRREKGAGTIRKKGNSDRCGRNAGGL